MKSPIRRQADAARIGELGDGLLASSAIIHGRRTGTCMDIDAIYFTWGCILKIPDNTRCTLDCKREQLSCVSWPLGLVPRPELIWWWHHWRLDADEMVSC
jgi:hypothetical protein